MMDFENLCNLIFAKLIQRLERNSGLFIFAKERSKFEGWLKVELCEILSGHFQAVLPEKNRIDITLDNWAIELKTVNTNYRYKGVMNKTRPITRNVKGVIKDIEKLKSTRQYSNKAILFVVFPVTHNHKYWRKHLQGISAHLKKLKFKEFKFRNEIPGIIYFGLI